jgi:hypothetical protein
MTIATADQWLTASIHEAGHCAMYLRARWRFHSAYLHEDEGEVCGAVRVPAGRYNPILRAAACLSGPLSEAYYTGTDFLGLVRTSCRTDAQMARDALSRVNRWTAEDLDRLIPHLQAWVVSDWPLIQTIAAALLQYRHLSYDEVRRLIR